MALKFLLSFGVIIIALYIIEPLPKDQVGKYYMFLSVLGVVSFLGMIISSIWLIWETL